MAYDIFLERDGQVLRVRYSGRVGITERRAAAEAVLGRARHDAISRFLLDYRAATYVPSDPESSQALARYLADKLGHRNAKVAWLVTHDHQLGVAVERHTGEFGIPNRRFQNLEAAMAWLEQPTEPGEREDQPSAPIPAPAPPRRALTLAMQASDPMLPPLPPVQFAAIVKLVQELLDEGLDDDKVLPLARRMFEIAYGGQPRLAPSSSGRG